MQLIEETFRNFRLLELHVHAFKIFNFKTRKRKACAFRIEAKMLSLHRGFSISFSRLYNCNFKCNFSCNIFIKMMMVMMLIFFNINVVAVVIKKNKIWTINFNIINW